MSHLMKRFWLMLGILAVSYLSAQEMKPRVYYINPDWSPDGSKIVFELRRGDKGVVCTIQADGSGLRELTSSESDNGQPRWSSDGRQIVFISNRDGRDQLYLMSADGSHQRRLTNAADVDFLPDLSPKGDQVAFTSSQDVRTRTTEIYVMHTDGTGRTRLTDDGESVNSSPRWSPDGKKIVFSKGMAMPKNYPALSSEEKAKVRAQVKNSAEIFIMDKDGSHLKNLTNNTTPDGSPQWSGQTIYFMSERDGAPNVYAIDADGGHARKVADGKVVRGTNISRDGKYFVYSKDVDKKSGLYIYDLKNGTERRLIGE